MVELMSRRERKKQYSKKAIAEAAMKLFSQKGCKETSIADIMKEADLGIGTFYNYFQSKEEILKVLLGEIVGEIDRKFTTLEKREQSAAISLAEMFRLTAQLLDRNRFVLPLFLSAAEKGAAAKEAPHEQSALGFKRIFQTMIDKGQSTGEFRQDIPAAVITEIFHSVFQAAAFSSLEIPFLLNVEYKFRLVLDGMRNNPDLDVDRVEKSC